LGRTPRNRVDHRINSGLLGNDPTLEEITHPIQLDSVLHVEKLLSDSGLFFEMIEYVEGVDWFRLVAMRQLPKHFYRFTRKCSCSDVSSLQLKDCGQHRSIKFTTVEAFHLLHRPDENSESLGIRGFTHMDDAKKIGEPPIDFAELSPNLRRGFRHHSKTPLLEKSLQHMADREFGVTALAGLKQP
jgi:hypothetical protein